MRRNLADTEIISETDEQMQQHKLLKHNVDLHIRKINMKINDDSDYKWHTCGLIDSNNNNNDNSLIQQPQQQRQRKQLEIQSDTNKNSIQNKIQNKFAKYSRLLDIFTVTNNSNPVYLVPPNLVPSKRVMTSAGVEDGYTCGLWLLLHYITGTYVRT